MKVLYISYDGMTDQLGRSQVLPYLCGLSGRGVRFTLISFEKESRFKSGSTEVKNITDSHNIRWIPLSYTKNPPVISTLYDLWRLRRKAVELHHEFKFDIVHCRSYISSITGLYLKKRFGIPFVFDMRGFWVDERIDGGIWKLSNPVYKIMYHYFKKLERRFLAGSDITVSLTFNGKEEILKWKPQLLKEEQIKVIPCCADLDHFDYRNFSDIEKNNIREKFGIGENDLVLLYLGALGTWYMLEEMLDFFKVMNRVHPTSKFLFITTDDAAEIKNAAIKKDIAVQNIVVVSATRQEVPLYISVANLSIFFIKPLYSKKASSPTKQGELMGMGIPIFCNHSIGDTDRIIDDSSAGFIFQGFTEIDYETAVSRIPAMLSTEKEQIRKGAIKYYSLIDGVDNYFNIYKEIMSDDKAPYE